VKPEGGVVDDRLLELKVLGEPSEASQHLEAVPSADTHLSSLSVWNELYLSLRKISVNGLATLGLTS